MARCAAAVSSGISGLLKKMNSSFIAIVSDEVWRFLQTHAAQCAARVHISLSPARSPLVCSVYLP